MSTVKSHLAKLHERHAANHLKLGNFHKAMADHFQALGECMEKSDVAECLSAIRDLHKTMAAHHANEAESHLADAKELSAAAKADGVDDLSKIVPIPGIQNFHGEPPAHVRLVPRAGQPSPDVEKVSPSLQKLVAVD